MLDMIIACLDMGITTFDNAAIYGGGEAEKLFGDALALNPSLRGKMQLVTKCSIGNFGTSLYHRDTSKAHIMDSVEQSLKKMRTDRIDVLLIHRSDPLMDADEVAEAFTELRKSGKVLHFGVSNFTPSQFELLASRLDFLLVTNEVELSVIHLDTWYDGTLDLCQRLRISPMAWGPLGGGRLFRDDTEQVVRIRKELGQIGESLERLELSREQWFRIWVASTGERLP
jgi:predicted oxidoreductase